MGALSEPKKKKKVLPAVAIVAVVVILAIIAGSEFRGVVGALLAVPMAAAASVIIGDIARERRESEAASKRGEVVLSRES